MAPGKMNVNFQANVMTGAAASGAAGANAATGPGAEAGSPAASGFGDVLRQMGSNSGSQRNDGASSVTTNEGTGKSTGGSVAMSGSDSGANSGAGAGSEGATPSKVLAVSDRSGAARNSSQDAAGGQAAVAADMPNSSDGSKSGKKSVAKQDGTGISWAGVFPVAVSPIATAEAGETNSADSGGGVTGAASAAEAGGTGSASARAGAVEPGFLTGAGKAAARGSLEGSASAEMPDVTTTAAGAMTAKTPVAITGQAARVETSSSLQDARLAQAATTTGTATAATADANAPETKNGATADGAGKNGNEQGKSAAGVKAGADLAAQQAQAGLVAAATGAASAAARPAGSAGQNAGANLAGAAQNTKTRELTGAHPAPGTAVPGPSGAESAATRGHSDAAGQNSHSDSTANSDKGQAAGDAAAGKPAANTTGARAFGSQVGAAHDPSGHAAAANPATTVANTASGGTSAGAGARAPGAGVSNGWPFSPAAIAGQSDAGVAGGAAAMGDGAVAGAYSAQMVARAARSEMRIQFQADGLGPVELRAAAEGNTIGATITTDRPETHWLLASGVGTLHQALADHNVQVERIDIVFNSPGNGGQASGGGTGSGGGSGAQSNEQGTARPWAGTASSGIASVAVEEATTSSGTSLYRGGRLSVRA
jgi:hypothetical protein